MAEASADMAMPERLRLANAPQQGVRCEGETALPLRQNRRTPLIEAALEHARKQF